MGRKRRIRRPKPQVAGQGVIAEVDVDSPDTKGTKDRVRRRLSPIRLMLSRHEISEGHVIACERFLVIAEAAELGGARAIDYTCEPVDGGRVAQPLSLAAMAAGRELVEIARAVGSVGYTLLTRIVVLEHGIVDVARAWPCPGNEKRREGYIKGRLVEAADVLVDHFGMIAEGKPRARARVSAEGHTGPVREWAPGRFGDMVEVGRRS